MPLLKRLLLIVLVLMMVGVVGAQTETVYTDPDGQFTVPVPQNWTTTQQEGYVVLNDPDQLINIYILVVTAENATEGVKTAWQQIDPTFAFAAVDTQNPPPPAGIEEYTVITYDPKDDTRIIQAVAQRIGEQIYVLIADADLNTLIQRNAQSQTILSGFKITGQSVTDLSSEQPLTVDAALSAEIEAYTAQLLIDLEVPGAAVAILQDGEIVYEGAFGVKELGKPDLITTDTQFMIGSATKPMTTTMMARLVDEGVFTWDTPVVDVLPDFAVSDPDLTARFTIRNLVCACTGVPRRDLEFLFNASNQTPEGIIASLQTFEFFTDFGETFQYSNQLVATAGYAAAAALNPDGDLYTEYLDAMQARFFDPIGMTRTTFDLPTVLADNDYAVPHGANMGGLYVPLAPALEETLLKPIAPAGAVWSTVGDMTRYMQTMLNQGVAADGTRIVSSENLAATWQPQVAINADVDYGLGWILSSYKGVRVLGHDGNTLGFTASMQFLPDTNLGIVVLSNGQAANTFNTGITSRILELLYAQPMEADAGIRYVLEQGKKALAELKQTIGAPLTEDAAAPFLGVYSNAALSDITIVYTDGELRADTGEFVTSLRPNKSQDAAPDTFITFDPPLAGVPLKFDGDTAVINTGVEEYIFTRQP